MAGSSPTRERILDAAAVVLAERGIAGATTRELARAAGCSEALLYKHFADKQELFIAVLDERMPRIEFDEAASPELDAMLRELVVALLAFFVRTFPMAASIFGAPELLAEHRDGVRSRGFGPEGVVRRVQALLESRRAAGGIRADADLETAARMLVGFAFHRAFLSAYAGESAVPGAEALAERGVALVLPALAPR